VTGMRWKEYIILVETTLEKVDVGGRVLKNIVRQYDGRAWTGLM
jgi:hypothetical protein